ncbi:hypothetical protein CYMTET_46968 [Cymbomonas tetramitiformis]|uniref:Uncharacterized protein n=1 Tax=Cymbomonas tetramitiformis TaxID=36881 RepID=A0AAE0BV47_9CHLO|nr:hypothetical protein CYMTET_46968 [Cymbomonas tetramitiformis]
MYGDLEVQFQGSWQYIIVKPDGSLVRWERMRGAGWFLDDATKGNEFVAPFDYAGYGHLDYHGIPFYGRKLSGNKFPFTKDLLPHLGVNSRAAQSFGSDLLLGCPEILVQCLLLGGRALRFNIGIICKPIGFDSAICTKWSKGGSHLEEKMELVDALIGREEEHPEAALAGKD